MPVSEIDRPSLQSPPLIRRPISNILTVDVEEYFHPTEVQASVSASEWSSFPSRVEGQVALILDLFRKNGVKGTFFVLGWVAERCPGMLQLIAAEGHEIGCHSYWHQLVYDLTPDEFKEDTLRAVRAIEDACGVTPRLYRAPSYSITKQSMWALEVLVECGFTHDSSIYPITHDRYGIAGFERHPHVVKTPSGPIQEVPIATVKLGSGRVAPVGGGGYLRLLPYCYTAAGIRRVNQREGKPACVYFHPWEIDPGQPRIASGCVAKIRTYGGVGGMERKLERLLSDFRFRPMTEGVQAE